MKRKYFVGYQCRACGDILGVKKSAACKCGQMAVQADERSAYIRVIGICDSVYKTKERKRGIANAEV